MTKKMIGLIAMGVLLLTGCSNTSGDETPSSAVVPTTPPVVTETTNPADAERAGEQAQQIAVDTVSAFLNHGRSQDEWWADFSQHLSPEALYVWNGVRADRVIGSAVTGEPVVSVADTTFVTVLVPTDVGTYRLVVVKRVSEGSGDGAWLIFEMTAPVPE